MHIFQAYFNSTDVNFVNLFAKKSMLYRTYFIHMEKYSISFHRYTQFYSIFHPDKFIDSYFNRILMMILAWRLNLLFEWSKLIFFLLQYYYLRSLVETFTDCFSESHENCEIWHWRVHSAVECECKMVDK